MGDPFRPVQFVALELILEDELVCVVITVATRVRYRRQILDLLLLAVGVNRADQTQ